MSLLIRILGLGAILLVMALVCFTVWSSIFNDVGVPAVVAPARSTAPVEARERYGNPPPSLSPSGSVLNRERVTAAVGVVQDDDGRPLAGVEIVVYGRRVDGRTTPVDEAGLAAAGSDVLGAFAIHLPPELAAHQKLLFASFRHPGFTRRVIEFAPAEEIGVVTLASTSRFTVIVREQGTGVAVSGAHVEVVAKIGRGSQWWRARTDTNGRARFVTVPRRRLRINVMVPGKGMFVERAQPVEGAEIEVWVYDPERCSGVVVDASTGRPLPGAVVSTQGRHSKCVTDPGGRFSMPASIMYRVEREGYATRSVASGGIADLGEVEITRDCPLVVRWQGFEGKVSAWVHHLEGQGLVVRDWDERAMQSHESPIEIRGLRPNSRLMITLRDSSGRWAITRAETRASGVQTEVGPLVGEVGARLEVVVDTPSPQLTGSVRCVVHRHPLHLRDVNLNQTRSVLGSDQIARFEGLPQGDAEVTFHDGSSNVLGRATVALQFGELVRVRMRIAKALTGTVRDAGGRSVSCYVQAAPERGRHVLWSKTDPNGVYSLPGANADQRYSLRIVRSRATRPIVGVEQIDPSWHPGGWMAFDIVVPLLTGKLTGKVEAASEMSLVVVAVDESKRRFSATVERSGRFTLAVPSRGVFWVQAFRQSTGKSLAPFGRRIPGVRPGQSGLVVGGK